MHLLAVIPLDVHSSTTPFMRYGHHLNASCPLLAPSNPHPGPLGKIQALYFRTLSASTTSLSYATHTRAHT